VQEGAGSGCAAFLPPGRFCVEEGGVADGRTCKEVSAFHHLLDDSAVDILPKRAKRNVAAPLPRLAAT